VKKCRTAEDYRLFALKTTPPKPGLVRESGLSGWGIEVEVWAMPQNEFGSFVAEVPSPLAIGNVTLEDGESVKGFVCEPCGHLRCKRDHPLRRLAQLSGVTVSGFRNACSWQFAVSDTKMRF